MLKKMVLSVAALAVLAVFGINVLSHKAPDLLKKAIGNALGKQVAIRDIRYYFPSTFELRGFEIKEDEPFSGEASFYVDEISLHVSPMTLSQKALVIDKIEVQGATIVVRKLRGRLLHSFSNAMKKGVSVEAAGAEAAKTQKGGPSLPLEIRKFRLSDGYFKFMDYDAQQDGFVVSMEKIGAEVKSISLPFSDRPTEYRVDAKLVQGREQKAGEFTAEGWTRFSSRDTDAAIRMEGVYLPYFRPYYGQVTQAAIQEGFLSTRALLRVKGQELDADIDFEIVGLLFESYEVGNQLFGMKAEEMLDFLKDSSGRLKLSLPVRWNLQNRSLRFKDILRSSIEKALKDRALGNVGALLLKKISDNTLERGKEGGDHTLKKIKELLQF